MAIRMHLDEDLTGLSERAKHVHEVWARVWNHGDVQAYDTLFDPSYRRISPAHNREQTAEEVKAAVTTTRAAFPDLVTVIEDLVEDSRKIALRWSSTGVHSAPLSGIPATHRSVTVSGVVFAHFNDDGLIVEEVATWDARQLLSALGVISIGTV